jgi:iron complex outermembrane receptor protein
MLYALARGWGRRLTLSRHPCGLPKVPIPTAASVLALGENGHVWRNEGQLGLTGARYDLSVQGAWAEGADYRTGKDEQVAAGFQRGSVGSQLGLKLTDRQRLRLLATYNFARDADFAALPMDLRSDDTWLWQAQHEVSFSSGVLQSLQTAIFGSFVDHLMDNRLKALDPRMMDAETVAKTQNYGARTEAQWRTEHTQLFLGMDWRHESAEGTRRRSFLLGPNAGKTLSDNAWQHGQIRKGALFGEYHLLGEQWRYTLAGRFEWNRASVTDPAAEYTSVYPETAQEQLNPSFSVGAHTFLGRQLQLGIWLGRAQRSGSLTERYINYFPVGQDPYEMLGNPNLRPEVNNQADLKLEWTQEKTSLRFDLFAAYLQDYISSVIDPSLSARLPNSPGVRRFVNLDAAFKTGFEFSWIQQLPAQLAQTLALAYTYGQDLDQGAPLPEIAPLDLRYHLRGSYWQERLLPAVTFRYVLAQDRIATVFGETTTPAFALLDVEVGYRIGESTRLHIGIDNVLDTNYYEHLNRSVRGTSAPIYAPGRNVFGSLSVQF